MPAALRIGQKAFIAALCSSFNEETLYSSEESAVTAASTLLPPPPLFGCHATGFLSELSPGCGGRCHFADWSHRTLAAERGGGPELLDRLCYIFRVLLQDGMRQFLRQVFV